MITCYPSPGKRKAMKICQAFAAGCGGRVAPVGRPALDDGAAFFYGLTPHSAALIAACRAAGRDWYYADNAYYVGRGTHFRVTRGGFMHDGRGEADPRRLESLGVSPAPWRRGGDRVVIATQSELFYRLHLGTTRAAWTAAVRAELAEHTDRPVVVCDKPAPPWPDGRPHANFEDALRGAWAVVSHSSSVMVKSLIDGVPVFPLGPSMAAGMGRDELSRIEAPLYPEDRERWLRVLAANQWTRAEMRDGTCWRELRAR